MTVSIVTTNELQTENDQGFVAVTSSRIKNNNYNRRSYKQDGNNNKKGKGRYIPPPQKTLAELLQQKIDLLRDSPFMKACIGVSILYSLYVSRVMLRYHSYTELPINCHLHICRYFKRQYRSRFKEKVQKMPLFRIGIVSP